ncbi:MAG: beta-lactamase family protein [Clostridia bacterium]|nr:beta-lactamase family protein [Clostridia bacterium]
MAYDLKSLDAALAKRIAEKKLPGVTVCIRGPEGVVFEKGYGVADEHGRPVNEHTVMGIASMSKSTVTLALCMLEAEGKCSFHDPIVKYFPSFALKGTPRQGVTLHHLATHTAGIPPMEPLEWSIAMNTPERRESDWTRAMKATAPNKMNTIDQIVDYIAQGRYPTLGEPGNYMSYSNEGYAILCYVVDQVAGIPLERFLSERVFGPMGMTRTVLDEDCSEAKTLASDGNITRLWERDDDGNFQCDDAWGILPPFRSCACVKSTAHDMARYYQCLSNHGVLDGKQVISAAAADRMVGVSFPLEEKPYYCYGLNKRLWHGHIICEHSGGLHGVSTHGGMLYGENYGFAALCNEGGQDTDDLCWMMYNLILGRPLEEKHIWLHPTGEAFENPEMLTGEYICHEGEPVTMRVYVDEAGRLMARRPLGDYTLAHCGETWFQFFNNAGELAGRCRFWVRDGKAWGVQVYTRIYQRIGD